MIHTFGSKKKERILRTLLLEKAIIKSDLLEIWGTHNSLEFLDDLMRDYTQICLAYDCLKINRIDLIPLDVCATYYI